MDVLKALNINEDETLLQGILDEGSVRGYATTAGLKSTFGYRPYGTTVYLDDRFVDEGNRRWQGAPSVVLFEKHLFSSIIFGADIF